MAQPVSIPMISGHGRPGDNEDRDDARWRNRRWRELRSQCPNLTEKGRRVRILSEEHGRLESQLLRLRSRSPLADLSNGVQQCLRVLPPGIPESGDALHHLWTGLGNGVVHGGEVEMEYEKVVFYCLRDLKAQYELIISVALPMPDDDTLVSWQEKFDFLLGKRNQLDDSQRSLKDLQEHLRQRMPSLDPVALNQYALFFYEHVDSFDNLVYKIWALAHEMCKLGMLRRDETSFLEDYSYLQPGCDVDTGSDTLVESDDGYEEFDEPRTGSTSVTMWHGETLLLQSY